jgi:predicted kinase
MRPSFVSSATQPNNQPKCVAMSLTKIQEQIKKNESEIEAKKKKHDQLQQKMADSLAKLVMQSGIMETTITEEELLKELQDIAARFRTKEATPSA